MRCRSELAQLPMRCRQYVSPKHWGLPTRLHSFMKQKSSVCVCVCVCVYLYICIYIYIYMGPRGGVVVKAPRYKPVGREFDSPWCHRNFSVTLSFRSHYGPGIDSASNRNEYRVYFLRVNMAGV